jgi:hypothetical protein
MLLIANANMPVVMSPAPVFLVVVQRDARAELAPVVRSSKSRVFVAVPDTIYPVRVRQLRRREADSKYVPGKTLGEIGTDHHRYGLEDHVAACQRQHVGRVARPGGTESSMLIPKSLVFVAPLDTSSQVLPDTLERVVDSESRYARQAVWASPERKVPLAQAQAGACSQAVARSVCFSVGRFRIDFPTLR